MGLSNEERIHKAIWAANRITTIAKKLDPECDDFWEYGTRDLVRDLKEMCLEVIPIMSGSQGNSLFWLIGPDEEVSHSSTSLWSLALYDRIKNAMTPEAKAQLDERNKKKEDMWGKEITGRDKKLFEPVGYLSEQHERVYDIYIWFQQFRYATNRYDDELSKSYSAVNGKIALIMNECFNIFNSEKEYAVAYLKAKVYPLLLGIEGPYVPYEKWDELTRYIIANHKEYQLSRYGDKWDSLLIDQIKRWWIQLGDNPSIKARFWIWMKLFEASGSISKSDEKELKKLCGKIGVNYEGKVSRMIEKGRKAAEKRASQRDDYERDKKYAREDLQERRTDSFHFIWNSED